MSSIFSGSAGRNAAIFQARQLAANQANNNNVIANNQANAFNSLSSNAANAQNAINAGAQSGLAALLGGFNTATGAINTGFGGAENASQAGFGQAANDLSGGLQASLASLFGGANKGAGEIAGGGAQAANDVSAALGGSLGSLNNGSANDSPQAGASSQVPQGVIDKFQGDNPNDVGDETRLPDGSFRMDADPKGLAWAAQNAGTYGLAADPNDPSRFAAAGSAAGQGAPAANVPAARQQALTAQLPQGPAAASTAKINSLPHGDPAKLDYYLRMQALATQSGNEGYAALFKQKAEIEKEALTPTTAQKNYEILCAPGARGRASAAVV